MPFLKLFKPKSPQDLETEGDAFCSDGLWGNAKVVYEKALSRLEKKGGDAAADRRLREKIDGTRESLTREHMQNAEELAAGGYYGEASDLLRLAMALTRDTGMKNQLDEKISDLERQSTGGADLPTGTEDIDPDLFQDDIADEDEHFFALCASLPEEIQMAYMGYGPNFKSGYLALNAGDFKTASKHLSSALTENDEYDTYIPLELATAYLNMGEGEKARQQLAPFLEKHPDALPAYQLMCDIHWEYREFDQALDLLASVPEDLKYSLAVILLHGETLFQAEEFHAAESLFNGFLESHGFNEQIARALARVYEALDRADAALDIYGNIMDTCRSCHTRIDPAIKEKYADISFNSGVRDTAILEIYLSLAQEIPVRAGRYYRKVSHIYKSQGNHKEAARFEKISEALSNGGNPTP